VLISSSEPALLQCLGTSSKKPEVFGVDLLASVPNGLLGFQRKTPMDLVASLHDDRMGTQRAQWKRFMALGGMVVVVIEGRMSWTSDGILADIHGKPFTRRQFRRLVHSLARQGVEVQHTTSTKDTAEFVLDLVEYHTQHRTGSKLSHRPGPAGQWGICCKDFQTLARRRLRPSSTTSTGRCRSSGPRRAASCVR